MFDFGLGELLLVGVVALIVIGPERLPKAARMAGNMVGKLQRLVSSVKQELNTQIELEELRKAKQEFESAASQFKDDLKDIGGNTQNDLNEISDGLKPSSGPSEKQKRKPAARPVSIPTAVFPGRSRRRFP